MRAPRRLVEDSELFAKLVADMKRRRPPMQPLEALLDVIDAMPEDAAAEAEAEAATARSGVRKWIFLVGAGFLIPTGVGILMAASNASGARERANPAADTSASAPVVADPSPAREVLSVSVDDLPDVSPPVASSTHNTAPRAVRSSTSTSAPVQSEVEIIVAARRALTSGDTNRCLSLVALHEREFPNGQYALEANVMRIEATASAGDKAGAAAMARRLLDQQPDNPYRGRLRSLLTRLERP